MDQEDKPNTGRPDSPQAPSATEPQQVDAPPATPATADQLAQVEEQMSSFERSTLRWARAAVIMSFLAAVFVCFQWWEMHSGAKDTHDLAVAAGNQATWTQRLAANTDTESGHMKDLADRMKDQADRTKIEADETKVLADEARIQAAAAKSAAETAKDTLHVSERAYVIASAMTLNASAGLASFPVINMGHIPSGKVTIIVHEATINVSDPNAPSQEIIPTETHWQHYDLDSLPPMQGAITYTANIPLPRINQDQINKGLQQIVIVGTVSYGDGFIGTSEQRWRFCQAGALYPRTKDFQWRPCDWSLYMPELISVDHWPKDEYQRRNPN